ncbi:MAG: 2-succinyl-5-enolpyruvyl-6-hydroxy-3-cyclohexene-1-carboxylic-acid synthase [Longimicrobiales bacterium]
MSAAATTRWARAFVDELARCGVEEVVVAPGSRSTPLVLALAADGRFRMRVHLDERSAAFFALGVGKATGRPGAVVTTSGTATANLYPAVVEAAQSETPLLVLTADRPARLRDADANQAIDQVRMYGGYAKAFFETAQPELNGPALRHLRGLACRAVAAAMGSPAGPVHVNLPFDKPLEPVADTPDVPVLDAGQRLAAHGRPDGRPYVDVVPARATADGATLDALIARLRESRRPVVVAGPSARAADVGPAAVAFAGALGAPLLADPLSGGRFAVGAPDVGVAGYDLFLRDPSVREALAPDLVVRVGAGATSASLQGWLAAHGGADHVVIDGDGRWKDHAALATRYLRADATHTLRALAERLEAADGPGEPDGNGTWTARWRAVDRAARDALGNGPAGGHEGAATAAAAAAVPDGGTLFVSSSMPVRDLDAFSTPQGRAVRVHGNRGASGIDGIVSTAFGAAAGPTVCVLGDLALFHDQNGLLFARDGDRPVVFVLIDNDGGGIFHMLPVADHEPHFTRFFATPHGLDFAHTAALHGLPLEDRPAAEVEEAVRAALDAGGTRIVRVRTERVQGQAERRTVAAAVAANVRAVLE